VLLLYCLTRANAEAPPGGIGGAALERVLADEVACWYSAGAPPSHTAKDDVLAFHRVLDAFLRKGAVIPFRFPTTLPDAVALEAWLGANREKIAGELERLGAMVQMEVHVAGEPAAPAASGKQYLESRRDAQRALETVAETLRQSVADVAAEWRQRETRDGLRCYALVPRGQEREFAARIDASGLGARVRVSGPWPPAEFLDPVLTKLA